MGAVKTTSHFFFDSLPVDKLNELMSKYTLREVAEQYGICYSSVRIVYQKKIFKGQGLVGKPMDFFGHPTAAFSPDELDYGYGQWENSKERIAIMHYNKIIK